MRVRRELGVGPTGRSSCRTPEGWRGLVHVQSFWPSLSKKGHRGGRTTRIWTAVAHVGSVTLTVLLFSCTDNLLVVVRTRTHKNLQ